MCLPNLPINISLTPEKIVDAIADNESAASFITAIIDRNGNDGFAVDVIRRIATYVIAGSEDSEDRREAKNWIMDEIEQQFQEMDR